MPHLTRPDVRFQDSFIAAHVEFRDEGRGGPDDVSTVGNILRGWSETWKDPEVFADLVARLRLHTGPGRVFDADGVPVTVLWYVDGDTYLGRLAVRHELDAAGLDYYGHIGYDVRPSARGRGHAKAMLWAALPVARELGIASVLVTCDDDNTASRRVIEACGGIFEDSRAGKLRYWIGTSS